MSQRRVKLKIVVIGHSKFTTGEFTTASKVTVNGNFLTKEVISSKEKCVCVYEIWDTAGQEKTQSITTTFFEEVDACVLVYDVSNHFSFETLTDWYHEFDAKAMPSDLDSFPFIVIGNKTDLGKQNVSVQEAEKWCAKMSKKVKIQHFEASAKSNINVDKAFKALMPLCLKVKPVERGAHSDSTTIGESSGDSADVKGGCCVVS
eukprot:g3236.t1